MFTEVTFLFLHASGHDNVLDIFLESSTASFGKMVLGSVWLHVR